MSQNPPDGFDPNDPLGTWRSIRDANLDAWARGMTAMVNTESFAKAIGMQLDTILAASAPVQKAVHQYMESYLAQVNMPSRNEVVSLAARLTNIELRLDDMQSQLDELLTAVRAIQLAPPPVAELPAPTDAPAAPPAAAPRRTRKARTADQQ